MGISSKMMIFNPSIAFFYKSFTSKKGHLTYNWEKRKMFIFVTCDYHLLQALHGS